MHGAKIQFFAMPFKERLKSGEPRKRPKQSYVPKNWSDYNKSLRKRGMLSLYLPKGDLGSQLINEESYKKGQSGREQVYTPAYVNLLFMLYRMHRMGLREFAGFMHDYWRGRGVELPVPSFGHLSDLFASLDITVRKKCVRAAERLNEGEPVTVIVDSTGLRFSHAGAWYEKKYGKKAERMPWRTMHLAMDAEGDVLAVEIIDTGTGDSSGLDLLLPQVGKIDRLIADTAYYQIERIEQLLASGVVPVIPPKADAVDYAKQNRWHDQLVRYLKEKGQYAFQNKYGYGLRARVEAQFSRIKRCIGDTLLTRRIASQTQEGRAIANLINQWNAFGQARCVKKA
ncbi:IS5 family transposase ISAzba3 [Paraburkholderia domus]|uniref:IS5 family transposase ISAzba3 n=2 Tax=Paraburkholderia domus TaxID=2793075 RepID=A0A9N8QT05_9BURK|nr:IS5 family transposase ISAzba3 [Paraburkholderia domus]